MPRLPYHALLLSCCCLIISSTLFAEDKTEASPANVSTEEIENQVDAGHSYHGESFNEGPRQSAYLIDGTGNVHLEVTTKSPEAQKFFDQGLGQLYGFWYFEAERSFRQAATLDPDCAMAYWGMAQANKSNEDRARGFIDEAVKRKKDASDREQSYIDAFAKYLKKPESEKSKKKEDDAAKDKSEDKDYEKKRRQALVNAYEDILHDYPDEIEAKALIGLALYENRSKGVPITSYYAVNAIMNEVLEKNPLHPCHHFRIHLWDYEKPELALNSAALCGASAPAIAHMWHMPGHIYSRLKRYHEAAWQQEASARVDHAHMMRDRLLPDQIHNFAHNNEWLIRNLIHVGRAHDAIDLAKNMIDLPRHPKHNTLKKRGSAQYGRMRLFQVLTEFRMWDEVLELQNTRYLEPTDDEAEQLKRLKLIAIAKFETGDVNGGSDLLTTIMQDLVSEKTKQEEKAQAATSKAKEDKKNDEKAIKKAVEAARSPFASRIKSLELAANELKGYLHLAHGEHQDAIASFEKVNGFDRSRLAELKLAIGETEEAMSLMEKQVKLHQDEVIPLAQFITIAWHTDKKDVAKKEFTKLQELSEGIDLDTPVFTALAPVAAELGHEGDWRKPREVASDFGERPALDSLGPFRWSPTSASDWTLTDHQSKTYSLQDYQGKPVVIIFYLGYGCLHCAEQLQKFAPQAEEFQKAGVELIAISTDDIAGLQQSHENYKDGTFPFPLVSNTEQNVFKDYRCYDDFEQQPLHGTFLVDGQGKTRWLDISYEPFMEPEFLLEEAQRLLKDVKPTVPPDQQRSQVQNTNS